MIVDHRVTGVGEPLLLLYGAGEDAELLQPQADALADRGFRVISYDRRGTGASTRENWPQGGVAQHVEDAARVISAVTTAPATVLGLSSGGVLALALAERRPDVVGEAIAWEPAALGALTDGAALHAQLTVPIKDYLVTHPTDWEGAYDLLLAMMSGDHAEPETSRGLRMRRNAEAAVRDDALIITAHPLDPRPSRHVTIATGAGVNPLLEQIAASLAAAYGTEVVTLPAADEHEVYLSRPDVLADAVTHVLADVMAVRSLTSRPRSAALG